MTLSIGNKDATTGMTKGIYDALREALEADLAELSEEQRTPIRASWKKMAYAISTGVIAHIVSNMEVFGITTQGNVSTSVEGNTASALPIPNNHSHSISLSGVESDVVFTQNNDGTGRVR
jgi:hypothetical protein